MNHDGVEPSMPVPLGVVVGGSLSRGLEVKLEGTRSLEGREIEVGRYVAIQGQESRFFALITDVELKAANPTLAASPPPQGDDFFREVMQGTALYGGLKVRPYLRAGPLASDPPRPAKTVPPHFAPVFEASQEDIERVFGGEDRGFVIGNPLDMDAKVRLDYERFCERSNGIFGKSGTGKTFLTLLILSSLIQRSNAQGDPSRRVVNLIFDMHNDYGWQVKNERRGTQSKGLKQHFGNSVAVFTLDEESARRRGVGIDSVVEVGYEDIEPEDIAVLRESLNLTPLAVEAVYALEKYYRRPWLAQAQALEGDEEKEVRSRLNIDAATFANLRRGLDKLTRQPFLNAKARTTSMDLILGYLLQGRNVVLEFGRYGDDVAAYVLVANLLTRRIREAYRKRVESALGDEARKPLHLIITIEEAHKFLNPQVANLTVFGIIAREMRKYNVTLLIIDQRPSGIDEEVMSQIGTKVAFFLDNDKDVEAVLAGTGERGELKGVLSRLESRRQALIFGHALPMPIVVEVEEYGPDFYGRLAGGPGLRERLAADPADDLYPPR
ncbi:MAG TPA: DUF87 domain-containing protein [Dehalococcoidia bacterium]|nr:DUF87 domain-containing protein [Dehalococcoidia bacterium]